MILDCEYIANQRKQVVKNIIQTQKLTPCLLALTVGENKSTQSYVKGLKRDCDELGIELKYRELSPDFDRRTYVTILHEYNIDPEIDAILLLNPIEKSIKSLLQRNISPLKDIDNFRNDYFELPCTVQATINLIKTLYDSLDGKYCVVINRSDDIGKPIARELLKENCTVTMCHSHTKELSQYTSQADIVIAATGTPHLLTKEDIKEDSTIIDLGTGFVDGHLVGDCDTQSCAEKAMFITPNPKGIGVLTRITLLENVVKYYTKYTL